MKGLLENLGVGFARGNVAADQVSYKTSIPKIHACGDMRRGQFLIVWAIREGRKAWHAVDTFLMGLAVLPG
jgi:glutamate synthase (NADPH) small chain